MIYCRIGFFSSKTATTIIFSCEHYVLLGNFVNDPDRFEVFDHLLLDFVRDFVLR